ncbi:hypothetical protein PUN28_011007 [Cardiocondyla obscurior]|uniref:F-box domain-containing protein n=2 Tax=Cardiocondyla obscurior TaxID=286306 RepID=A0AAW2FLB5_9HYME
MSISSRLERVHLQSEEVTAGSTSCANDKGNALSLLDLPVEIFLHICSYLETSTLVHRLSLVCKRFYLILQDDLLWKARINKIWPSVNYPILCPAKTDNLFWKSSCVAIEKQAGLWNSMEHLIINEETVTRDISAVLLIENGDCVIAARNNSLMCRGNLFNVPKTFSLFDKEHFTSVEFAHNGEIVNLTAIDNTIYSCGRHDQVIKSWQLFTTGLRQQAAYEVNLIRSPYHLASCRKRGLLATSVDSLSELNTVFVFDPRAGPKPILQYQPRASVKKLVMNTEYIVNTSYHGEVSVWDQRAARTIKSVKFSDYSPSCLNLQRDFICVGGQNLDSGIEWCYVLDPTKDFEVVKYFPTEHRDRLMGIYLIHGCLITICRDGCVVISSLTDPPKKIATFFSSYNIFSVDYLNDIFAIGNDRTIQLWCPTSKRLT